MKSHIHRYFYRLDRESPRPMRVALALSLPLILLLSPLVAGASLEVATVAEYDWTDPSTVAFTVFSDCGDWLEDQVTWNNQPNSCTYRWDMGDGTVLAGQTVNHTFALQGLWVPHQVELQACTPSGSVCETRFVPVLLVHWPAILGLVALLFVLLVLAGRKRIRIRILEVAR